MRRVVKHRYVNDSAKEVDSFHPFVFGLQWQPGLGRYSYNLGSMTRSARFSFSLFFSGKRNRRAIARKTVSGRNVR